MKKNISNYLNERRIYHKIKHNKIITRRSETTIPKFNKDLAYITGVIVGDGAMVITPRKKGGNHYVLSIFSNSKEYLLYLNLLFKKYFGRESRIYKDKRHEVHSLVIQVAAIFFYFVNIGLPIGKSEEEFIPNIIKSNKIYFIEYISGLIDTDGHISSPRRIQLKQKSKDLLLEIVDFLNGNGVQCNIPKVNYTNNKPYWYIIFDNKIKLRFKRRYSSVVEHQFCRLIQKN